LGKQYPRLLQSYALAATVRKGKTASGPEPTPVEIARFMRTSDERASQPERSNSRAQTNDERAMQEVRSLNQAQIDQTDSIWVDLGFSVQTSRADGAVHNRRIASPAGSRSGRQYLRFNGGAQGATRAEPLDVKNTLEVNDRPDVSACKT